MEKPQKFVSFYSNGSEMDKIAFYLLKVSKIPFEMYGPTSQEPTPFVEYNHWKFRGIENIYRFIINYQNNRFPTDF